MKKQSLNIRMNFPEPPEVPLPWYPRSAGSHLIVPGKKEQYPEIPAIEFIWVVSGSITIEFANPRQSVELKEKQSICRLAGEQRICRNSGKNSLFYRWVCIDGPEAEKFISAYKIPLRSALDSGECPEELFEEAESLLLQNTPFAMRRLISVITDIIARMIPHQGPDSSGRTFNAALSLIARNFHFSDFNVNIIADNLKLHRTTLCRIFHANAGKAPHIFLTEYRLRHALLLLKETTRPVNEIAHAVGFARANYFCRIFARKYGLTPGAFRKSSGSIASGAEYG